MVKAKAHSCDLAKSITRIFFSPNPASPHLSSQNPADIEGIPGEAGRPGGGHGGGRLWVLVALEAARSDRGGGVVAVLTGVGEESGGERWRGEEGGRHGRGRVSPELHPASAELR